MEGMYGEIYNYLSSIDKIDANIYSRLLSKYGENLVNEVINRMIDEDSNNLVRFDYYVNKIAFYDEMVSKSLIESYGIDISLIPTLTNGENIKLLVEIDLIVKQIKELFEMLEFKNNYDSYWLTDDINKFMLECNDKDKLEQMKSLYNKFIYKRNKIVEGNLRLVIFIAKSYNVNETIFIEAIQYGNIGLMRAVEKFSPQHNVTFATYSYYWIKQFITRGVYSVIYPYSIPEYQVSIYHNLKNTQKELEDELGREVTDDEIALKMGIKEEKVKFLKLIFMDSISLYETYGNDEVRDTMLIEFIVDENSSLSKNIDRLYLTLSIEQIINSCLTEREKIVVMSRFGFINDRCDTLDSTGRKIGVTRERVRQIELKALRKLNGSCNDLREYL